MEQQQEQQPEQEEDPKDREYFVETVKFLGKVLRFLMLLQAYLHSRSQT